MRFVDVNGVRSRFDEPLVARDGTRLSVDLYLPPSPGRYPVLVTRTPYDNNRENRAPGATTITPAPSDRFKMLAAHGFVVAACDVRGRGDSDGRFVPFAHEGEDGADAVRWARRLAECDGRVGLFGSGYAGFAALAAACSERVDAVAVWSPFGAEGTPLRGGALRLDWLFWMHLVGGRTPQPVDVPRWDRIFRHRPLISMHEALGRDDVWWAEWLATVAPPEGLDLTICLRSLAAPTLFVTGWWDGGLETTARQWEAARVAGAGRHALVIGPWDTEAVRHPRADVGGVPWGPAALVDPDEMLIAWFDAHLRRVRDAPSGARLFVTGRNEWIDIGSLEVPANVRVLWLASDGAANTRRGDGRLVDMREEGPADRFIHDPDRPVPWQANERSFSRAAGRIDLDTANATARDDVLVYDGEPAAVPLSILGRPVARLCVSSDARDADWIAGIEDVFPGGSRSVHLAHGIVRTGSLHGARPSRAREVTIAMNPVAHDLLPGHRLRLTVASSLWPLYAVNLGGGDYLRDVVPHRSEHAVHHDVRSPSRLEVPEVP